MSEFHMRNALCPTNVFYTILIISLFIVSAQAECSASSFTATYLCWCSGCMLYQTVGYIVFSQSNLCCCEEVKEVNVSCYL